MGIQHLQQASGGTNWSKKTPKLTNSSGSTATENTYLSVSGSGYLYGVSSVISGYTVFVYIDGVLLGKLKIETYGLRNISLGNLRFNTSLVIKIDATVNPDQVAVPYSLD